MLSLCTDGRFLRNQKIKLGLRLQSYNLVFKSPTHNEYGGVLLLQYANFFDRRAG
jgi:hypothetical protein